MEKLQSKFFLITICYVLFVTLYIGLIYVNSSISSIVDIWLLCFSSIGYLILYFLHFKTVTGYKRLISDIGMSFSTSPFFILIIVCFFNNEEKARLPIQIYVFMIIAFWIVSSAINILGYTLKSLVLLALLIFILGFFDKSWWTAIPLGAATVLFFCSKDIFNLIANTELEDSKIPFSLKKKWTKIKLIILVGSALLYISFVISDVMESYGVVLWLSKHMFKSENMNFFSLLFTKGVLRFFIVVLISIIGLVVYRKNKYINSVICEYKRIALNYEKKKFHNKYK